MYTLSHFLGVAGFIALQHPFSSRAVETYVAQHSVYHQNLIPLPAPFLFIRHESRDAPSCPAFSQNIDDDQGYDGSTSKLPVATTGSTTSPSNSSPTCSYHGPDPDGFAPEGWCVCESSITLSLTTPASTPAPESASCDYKTLPPATATFAKETPAATTSNCVVYQQIGANEDNDEEVPGCTPTGRPTTNVTLSNNHVAAGNQTGQSFHNAILNALRPKCHEVVNGNGTCDSKGTTIHDIAYVKKEEANVEYASMTFTIENGNYRTNEQRDSMLSAVALAFNASAQGKNCGLVKYNTCLGGESEPDSPMDVGPHGEGCMYPLNQCNVPNLVSVNMFDGGVEVGIMLVETSFKVDGWSEFDCQIVADIVADIVDAFLGAAEVVAPETAPADTAIIGEMEATCAELAEMAGAGGGG